MKAELVVPVLNVSDLEASFVWFERLGWRRGLAWAPQAEGSQVFGSVLCGDCEIVLCVDDQGGRGEHAAWMAVWVDDVDAVAARCKEQGLEVIHGPADEVWHVREAHVRHPDGHVLRISRALSLG